MPDPLQFQREDWRKRWLHCGRGVRLHRISAIDPCQPADGFYGPGISVCGKRGTFYMPGLFSRQDAPRCPACCAALGIPTGKGAPFNALKGKAADV